MATTTVTTKEAHNEVLESQYTIVRETTQVDRMFYIYHRLGIQANVLVAARYSSAQTGAQRTDLSDEAVFAALHTVITKHPELGLVGVVEPGDEDKHLLSIASLHTINLESCVEFIDTDVPELGSELFEKLHGQWLWADGEVKPGQPWWKVIVLGRRDIVFLFHHLVCDGSFGMTFHRELLAALNDVPSSGLRQQAPRQVHLEPEKVKLNENLKAAVHKKPPFMGVLYNLFMFLFFRFFYSKLLFFVDYEKPRAFLKDPLDIALPHERTVTKVANYRIPAQKMEAILAACREHGTTFTPLLMVMITGTLAADFYPKAKVGFTRYAVDMRPVGQFEDLAADQGKMLNLATSVPEPEWLKKYRRAFTTSPSPGEKGEKAKNANSKAVWKLVQRYGKRMKQLRKGGDNSPLYKSWLSGNTMGPTLEEFVDKSLPSLGIIMQNSYSVSNLGALKPDSASMAGRKPALCIEEVQFSTASPHGGVGYHGIVFNTAGVTGGDVVINACTEEGMAPDGLARAVLDGVMARIDALI